MLGAVASSGNARSGALAQGSDRNSCVQIRHLLWPETAWTLLKFTLVTITLARFRRGSSVYTRELGEGLVLGVRDTRISSARSFRFRAAVVRCPDLRDADRNWSGFVRRL